MRDLNSNLEQPRIRRGVLIKAQSKIDQAEICRLACFFNEAR